MDCFQNNHIENSIEFDFLFTLFCTAAKSFRIDTLLRPFPPMFYRSANESEEKDFDLLVSRRL